MPFGFLALLAAFGALANSSPEMSTPLNRLRRFPLQGTTPAARQSRFRGVPGRELRCACLAPVARSLRSPRGGWVASLLTPHSSLMNTTAVIPGLTRNLSAPSNALRRGTACRAPTPDPLPPHFSSWATTRVAPAPLKDSGRTQTSSFRAQSRNPCLPSRTHRCCDYAQHDGVCRATLPPHHPHRAPVIPCPYHPSFRA